MGHHHDHNEEGNIKVAFFLNVSFTIIELIGGIYTNSLAIMSDALHDFGDSLSIGLSWYLQRVSGKAKDQKFSYGYRRFSLLGAIINSVVLLVGAIFILSQAIPQLFDPEESDAQGMVVLAVVGILVNGVAVLRLKKGSSINAKVVSLHLIEDVLGWVAVLIGSIIMILVDAPFIDPLLSILISAYVLFNIYRNIKQSFMIILQGIPQNVNIDEIKTILVNIPEVVSIHDCHVWSMDGEYNVLSIHLVLDKNYSLAQQDGIKRKIRKLLKPENVHHATIELDVDEDCGMEEC